MVEKSNIESNLRYFVEGQLPGERQGMSAADTGHDSIQENVDRALRRLALTQPHIIIN